LGIVRSLTILRQFTAKQLNRQAAKAGKDETTEKGKLKKVEYKSHAVGENSSLIERNRQFNKATLTSPKSTLRMRSANRTRS